MKCIFSIRIRQFHEYFYKSSKSAFESTIESIIFELTWSDALNYVHIFCKLFVGFRRPQYCEKISHFFLTLFIYLVFFKKVKILFCQIFVSFSEYMNFTCLSFFSNKYEVIFDFYSSVFCWVMEFLLCEWVLVKVNFSHVKA